jgi:hypothetical protein
MASETHVAVHRGSARAPSPTIIREAAAEWIANANASIVRTRSGHPYKPLAIRSYTEALNNRIVLELGHLRLTALTRNMLQDLIDRTSPEGLSPSTMLTTGRPATARSDRPGAGGRPRGRPAPIAAAERTREALAASSSCPESSRVACESRALRSSN